MTWKSPRLSKHQMISTSMHNCFLSIEHVDRTIDPYLAQVIRNNVIVYTGLHATLADARQTCEGKAK